MTVAKTLAFSGFFITDAVSERHYIAEGFCSAQTLTLPVYLSNKMAAKWFVTQTGIWLAFGAMQLKLFS